jgi:archaellum component FlaF (FlaF/FlaG flagellin family)
MEVYSVIKEMNHSQTSNKQGSQIIMLSEIKLIYDAIYVYKVLVNAILPLVTESKSVVAWEGKCRERQQGTSKLLGVMDDTYFDCWFDRYI